MDRVRKTVDLSPTGAALLEKHAERLGVSQTAVVELAVRGLIRPIDFDMEGTHDD